MDFKPYNTVGKRILIVDRPSTIIEVKPPLFYNEVERIVVQFDDDQTIQELPIKGIRIGSDWIR